MSIMERIKELTKAQLAAGLYTGAALSVVGGCALVAAVKYRLVHRLLPSKQAAQLDGLVDRAATTFAPVQATSMAAAAAKVAFLQSVYARTCAGFALGGLGTLLFVRVPNLPVVPAIIVSGMCFGMMVVVPDKVSPAGRRVLFTAACFCGGIAMGPLNWIAQKTNSVLFATAFASALSFAVAPLLTRSWVTNAFVAQALSSSLALLAAKALVLGTFPEADIPFRDLPLFEGAFRFATYPLNVDWLLLIQAGFNASVVVLHTHPVMADLLHGGDLSDANADRDALLLCGSVTYAVVELFRSCVKAVARAIKKGGGGAEVKRSDLVDKLAQGTSLVTFMFLYVKLVARIQASADVENSFRRLRWIFSKLTPVRVVA